jgi:transcription-repair coupling factor (superfamily II helicase)
VSNLLSAAEIRLQSERINIAQLDRKRVQMEENKQKVFREMVIVKFDAKAKIDPGMLMKLVSRNTKKGAKFTPQGVLYWPLSSAQAADVIAETKALLEQIDGVPIPA